MARKKSIHYVNNGDFSTAVVDYVEKVDNARKENNIIPTWFSWGINYVPTPYIRRWTTRYDQNY